MLAKSAANRQWRPAAPVSRHDLPHAIRSTCVAAYDLRRAATAIVEAGTARETSAVPCSVSVRSRRHDHRMLRACRANWPATSSTAVEPTGPSPRAWRPGRRAQLGPAVGRRVEDAHGDSLGTRMPARVGCAARRRMLSRLLPLARQPHATFVADQGHPGHLPKSRAVQLVRPNRPSPRPGAVGRSLPTASK